MSTAADIEAVYLNRANETRRVLTHNGKELSTAARNEITRVKIEIEGVGELDTDVQSDPIEYTTADAVVAAQFGLISDLEPGIYVCKLVVYTSSDPEGLGWGRFNIRVYDWGD